MHIFEQIFEQVLENKVDTSNNFQLSDIFIFTHHFLPCFYKVRDKYSWEKYITYKYFILNNFLNVNHIDKPVKERMLTVFSKVQKHIMALYRFKTACKFKTK